MKIPYFNSHPCQNRSVQLWWRRSAVEGKSLGTRESAISIPILRCMTLGSHAKLQFGTFIRIAAGSHPTQGTYLKTWDSAARRFCIDCVTKGPIAVSVHITHIPTSA